MILVQEVPGGEALDKARAAAARMELLDAFLVRADLDPRQIDDTRVWLAFERSGELRGIATVWEGIGLPALAVATPPSGFDERVARELLGKVREALRRGGPDAPWIAIDTRAREPAFRDAFTIRDRREELHMLLPEDVALPLAESVPIEPVGEGDLEKLDRFLQTHGATAWSPRSFEPGRYFWVRREGEVVAAAGMHFETDDVGQIANVLVAKDARRDGLGPAVTVAVARRIRASGKVASLFVRSDNDAAIALYERLGFKTVRRMASLVLA